MARFPINPDHTFRIDEIDFHIDVTPRNRRKSQSNSFTIVKDRQYLDIYAELADTVKPKSILELGIFEGGSYVLFDKIFKPDYMSAVDIRKEPVEALLEYAKHRSNRYHHFGSSQTDAELLNKIIQEEFSNQLHMVVDDASHSYALTRQSFELLYPRLIGGGFYIIEDWAWAHLALFQQQDTLAAQQPALTNLIFDLIQLQGSTDLIAEMRIHRSMVIIRKPERLASCPTDMFSLIRNRGNQLNQI
jgi:hypothetical protein